MLLIKGLLRALFQALIFGALLFLPAGTTDWPRAVQFLVGFAVVSVLANALLAKIAPRSLEARLPGSAKEQQPTADRIASLLIGIALLAWFVFIPLDVFRFHLLPPPARWTAILAAILLLGGYALMVTALIQNEFAIPVVKEQSDRGQTLIDTGVYGVVRHPMYTGFLLFLAGLALWLESLAALVAVPLAFAPILLRITVEEKTLVETLEGYEDYRGRVRSRLIPLLW